MNYVGNVLNLPCHLSIAEMKLDIQLMKIYRWVTHERKVNELMSFWRIVFFLPTITCRIHTKSHWITLFWWFMVAQNLTKRFCGVFPLICHPTIYNVFFTDCCLKPKKNFCITLQQMSCKFPATNLKAWLHDSNSSYWPIKECKSLIILCLKMINSL